MGTTTASTHVKNKVIRVLNSDRLSLHIKGSTRAKYCLRMLRVEGSMITGKANLHAVYTQECHDFLNYPLFVFYFLLMIDNPYDVTVFKHG